MITKKVNVYKASVDFTIPLAEPLLPMDSHEIRKGDLFVIAGDEVWVDRELVKDAEKYLTKVSRKFIEFNSPKIFKKIW